MPWAESRAGVKKRTPPLSAVGSNTDVLSALRTVKRRFLRNTGGTAEYFCFILRPYFRDEVYFFVGGIIMIKVTLKDNTVKELPKGITAYEAAKEISMGLARNACAARINGENADLRDTLDGEAIQTSRRLYSPKQTASRTTPSPRLPAKRATALSLIWCSATI